MSDFGELCPIFNTGVYHELYMGRITASVYSSATFNYFSSVGDPATAPVSLNLGRTVVVTACWIRRKGAITTATISLQFGRRTGTGTADQSNFALFKFAEDATAYPDYNGTWQKMTFSASMTLNTADYLSMHDAVGDATNASFDVLIQYREK